jgi:hypothetical protein
LIEELKGFLVGWILAALMREVKLRDLRVELRDLEPMEIDPSCLLGTRFIIFFGASFVVTD